MFRRFLYKIAMKGKSQSMDMILDRMLERIEVHQLVDSSEILKGKTKSNKSRLIFKSQSGDKISYNIFYNNMQVRVEKSPKESVYSIHLKKQDDYWTFDKDVDGNYDFSHPTTSTFRVFIAYDVPVLNITRAKGEAYSHGTWDEYVYRATEELERDIYNCTDEAQFNKCYDCGKKETEEPDGMITVKGSAIIVDAN